MHIGNVVLVSKLSYLTILDIAMFAYQALRED